MRLPNIARAAVGAALAIGVTLTITGAASAVTAPAYVAPPPSDGGSNQPTPVGTPGPTDSGSPIPVGTPSPTHHGVQ